MNIDDIIRLMQAVSENKLTSFILEEGDTVLSMKCKKDQPHIVTVSSPSMDAAGLQALNGAGVQALNGAAGSLFLPSLHTGAGPLHPVQAQEAPSQEAGVDIGSDKVVTSPLVGTFYASSSPDTEAFVAVGDRVKKGQVLGIIEAMKLMNEIESEYDGIVEAILVNNEEVVEYGQPMFRIK